MNVQKVYVGNDGWSILLFENLKFSYLTNFSNLKYFDLKK